MSTQSAKATPHPQKSLEVLPWTVPQGMTFPAGSTLLYPCCGTDLVVPLRLFKDYIDVFWFVDLGFLPHAPGTPQPQDALSCDWLLHGDPAYQPLDVQVSGTLRSVMTHSPKGRFPKPRRWLDPCIRTECYVSETGRILTIHRKRGFGENTLASLGDLSVFFLRGDSRGEGGSGLAWLSKPFLRHILTRLTPSGLIISDGSNSGSLRKRFAPRQADGTPATVRPFTSQGKAFLPLGELRRRGATTHVWQVH